MTAQPRATATERVRVEIRDHVAHVTLDRPEKRNALDLPMFEALAAAADRLGAEQDLRAVVLSGAGPAFCAGLDLKALMARPQEIERLIGKAPGEHANLAQRVAWAWRQLPVPVIAALRGEVFGGGLQIALGADLRLVAPDARLSVMEIRWGLIPDMAGSRLLRHQLRPDVAKELTMTGRIVGAEEAVALGLATRLCDDPVAEAAVLAADVAARSPDAIRAAKCLFDHAGDLDDAAGLELETRLQLGLVGQPNQLEAVRAGLAGEAPSFRPASLDLAAALTAARAARADA